MAWLRRDSDLEKRLREIVESLPLFEGLKPDDLRPFIPELRWFCLATGGILTEDTADADELYIVTEGSLGLWVHDAAAADNALTLIDQFGSGRAVGELAMLLGERRQGSLRAIRDSELIAIHRDVFDRIAQKFPVVMKNLSLHLAQRLSSMIEGRRDPATKPITPRTITLVPLDAGVPVRDLAETIVATVRAEGRRAVLVDQDHFETDLPQLEHISGLDDENDMVVFLSDSGATTWSRLCLRQADRVVVVAAAERHGARPAPVEAILRDQTQRHIELIVLYQDSPKTAQSSSAWVKRIRPDFHHNVRRGNTTDIARLVRHFTGRAVGLVLGGGGARGFAHIGVLRALMEANVPIDMVGGTSMGAIIAASIAMDWDYPSLRTRIRSAFVANNPLNDYMWFIPVRRKGEWTGFIRGKKINRLLIEHFGNTPIEELWRPFYCVSADLSQGRQVIHRSGATWRALRSSVAIPGLIAPVLREGSVLVDGGIVNNLPVTIMAQHRRGPVIAVDIESEEEFTLQGQATRDDPPWGILGVDVTAHANVFSILTRAGTMSSELQRKTARSRADLLMEPDLGSFSIRDWKKYDQILDRSYEYARRKLQDSDLSVLRGER